MWTKWQLKLSFSTFNLDVYFNFFKIIYIVQVI